MCTRLASVWCYSFDLQWFLSSAMLVNACWTLRTVYNRVSTELHSVRVLTICCCICSTYHWDTAPMGEARHHKSWLWGGPNGIHFGGEIQHEGQVQGWSVKSARQVCEGSMSVLGRYHVTYMICLKYIHAPGMYNHLPCLQLSCTRYCSCRSTPRSEACQMSHTAYGADLRLMGGRHKFAPAHSLGLVRTRPAVSLYQTAPRTC